MLLKKKKERKEKKRKETLKYKELFLKDRKRG